MFKTGKSVVGLDVGTTAIKAVELTEHGKDLSITGFGQIELAGDRPEDAGQAIADLMKEAGFSNKHIVTAVSGKQVVIRYLTMAAMTDDELRNAILFEAEKYIPFTLDECVLDCQRLVTSEDTAQGNVNVVLAAVKKSQVEDHLQTLQSAGCLPEVVDIDAFALGNAYELTRHATEARGEVTESVVALVDVGATKTSLNIVNQGTSLFTREIYFGGHDFTAAIARRMNVEESSAEALKRNPGENADAIRDAVFPTIDDLGNELQLSFDYFESQYGTPIEKILLTGGGARFPFFREAFEKIFEKPTSVLNPFEGLHVSDEVDPDLLQNGSPQLAIAVGLASRILKG